MASESPASPAPVPTRTPIQMLWVGQLSNLERLSMASFIANGHGVHLYSYEEPVGVPAGVRVLDARSILPEERVFRYGPLAGEGAGSIAPFSDVFRYRLLAEKGGWWSDADVICLRPFDFDAEYVFAYQDQLINNAVLRFPPGSALAEALYEGALKVDELDPWASTGPILLTPKVRELGLEAYALPASVFYPIFPDLTGIVFKADSRTGVVASLIRGSHAVHFWNEIIRRKEFDKDATYPAASLYEQLKARYGVGSGPAK